MQKMLLNALKEVFKLLSGGRSPQKPDKQWLKAALATLMKAEKGDWSRDQIIAKILKVTLGLQNLALGYALLSRFHVRHPEIKREGGKAFNPVSVLRELNRMLRAAIALPADVERVRRLALDAKAWARGQIDAGRVDDNPLEEGRLLHRYLTRDQRIGEFFIVTSRLLGYQVNAENIGEGRNWIKALDAINALVDERLRKCNILSEFRDKLHSALKAVISSRAGGGGGGGGAAPADSLSSPEAKGVPVGRRGRDDGEGKLQTSPDKLAERMAEEMAL